MQNCSQGSTSYSLGHSPTWHGLKSTAYGHAYLALGMLSDQAGRWGPARRFYGQAIRENPRTLGSYDLGRRYVKTLLGRRSLVGRRFLTGQEQLEEAPDS